MLPDEQKLAHAEEIEKEAADIRNAINLLLEAPARRTKRQDDTQREIFQTKKPRRYPSGRYSVTKTHLQHH